MFGGKSMLEWLREKSMLEFIGLIAVLVLAFYVLGAAFLIALSLWPLWIILYLFYIYRKNRA
jgi:hypothetical protein